MPTPRVTTTFKKQRETTALKKQLEAYASALTSGKPQAVATFFSPDADFRSSKGIMRGAAEVAGAAAEQSLRASAAVISIKWLSSDMALVDGNFEVDDGKGWFTEIWHKSDHENYLIRSSRIRVGHTTDSFEALNRLSPATVSGDVPAAVHSGEEKALRQQFKAFRTAFNKGDSKAVMDLCTQTCDAVPVFSFLKGRAQILSGNAMMEEKAARMLGETSLSANPSAIASERGRGAVFVGGEPKVIRFLSSTVAVVDGTAEIAGIPSAHEFSPREMKGVYSNVWTKSGGKWRCEGARAWF